MRSDDVQADPASGVGEFLALVVREVGLAQDDPGEAACSRRAQHVVERAPRRHEGPVRQDEQSGAHWIRPTMGLDARAFA